MKIYEVLWFESYVKLGSVSEVKTSRIGIFKIKRDADEAGMAALKEKDHDIVASSHHYEQSPGGMCLIFRSEVGGYEEHRFQYRIDELELQ